MQYLKRLRQRKGGTGKSQSTNWPVLLLLLAGAGSLAWYVWQLDVREVDLVYDEEAAGVVEREDERTATTTEEMATTTVEDSEYTGLLRSYRDAVASIEFQYPVEWGVVSVGVEEGECAADFVADDCAMRTYSVQDPASGQSAVFLVTANAGHGQYPLPRGAFWGDFVHQQGHDWQRACREATYCQLMETPQSVVWAYHDRGAEIDSSIFGQELVAGWYYTTQEGQQYDRFVFSPVELQWAFPQVSEVYQIVLETLVFE